MTGKKLSNFLTHSQAQTAVATARTAWIIGAGIVFLLSILMVVRAYLPMPLGDEWGSITISDYLARLFTRHSEHVIFFPRLVFLIDLWLFSGSHVFNLFATLLVEFLHAVLLAWLCRRAGLSVLFQAFAFIALFWAYQFSNFISGFQVQFVGVYAAATGAFAVLTFQRERGLPWAIFLGFVATLTMANGLLVGVLLVPLTYYLSFSRRHIVVTAVSSIAMILSYFFCVYVVSSAGPEIGGSTGGFLERIATAFVYFGVYLGAPLGRIIFRSSEMNLASIIGATAIGYSGLSLLFYTLAKVWRRDRLKFGQAQVVLIWVLLFVLISGAMVALGRAVKFPLYTAATGRYGTPALLFWFTTLSLTASARLSDKRRFAAIPSIVAVLLGATMIASQPAIMSAVLVSPGLGSIQPDTSGQYKVPRRLAERTAAVTAVRSRVFDEAAFRTVEEGDGSDVLPMTARLRAENLAPFHFAWARWLGQPLPGDVLKTGDWCHGSVDAVLPLPKGGWRIAGTMNQRRSNVLLIVSRADLVVGYATRSPGRTLLESIFNSNDHWQGHVSDRADGPITAYAYDTWRKSACPLGKIDLLANGRTAPTN